MALPQTVGFQPEAVDEEGVWCACTVEEVDDDYVHCLIGKESEETFPFSEQCLRFKKNPLLLSNITQTPVNKKLKLWFASISGVNLHNLSWTKSLTFKDQNHFLNYICFIFIHLANKAFQITVKTPDVVHFEFLDLS